MSTKSEDRQERPDPDAWGDEDAVALRAFLNKNPKFIRVLRLRQPKISEAETIEARAMTGSERKGSDAIFDSIEELSRDQPQGERPPFI